MKTIIAGVDGSVPAGRAAHRAAELARALGAELHVVTAYGRYEEAKYRSGSEEYVISNEMDADELLATTVADLRQKFPDVTVTTAPYEGKPADALISAAELLHADIIVVGNKRVQGVLRVLGSVARDVASRTSCDLYVAHTHDR